jgi:hypothetical protein
VSLARVRALAVLGGLVLLAAVAAGWAIAKDAQTGDRRATSCVQTTVPFARTVPESATGIRVNVYNATSRSGLAGEVAQELLARGFTVDQVGNDPLQAAVAGVAQIRYGPRGAGMAQVLRAELPGAEAKLIDRRDAEVDVVVGMAYERLATVAEYQQERVRLGAPRPPADLC